MIFYGVEIGQRSTPRISSGFKTMNYAMATYIVNQFEYMDNDGSNRIIVYRDENTGYDYLIGNNTEYKANYRHRVTFRQSVHLANDSDELPPQIDYTNLAEVGDLPIPTVAYSQYSDGNSLSPEYIGSDIPTSQEYYPNARCMNCREGFSVGTWKHAHTTLDFTNTFEKSTNNLTVYVGGYNPLDYKLFKSNLFDVFQGYVNNYNSDTQGTTIQLTLATSNFWYNIPISENLQECIDFVNGGALPSDAQYNELKNPNPAPEPEPPEPEPTPDDSETDDSHNYDDNNISQFTTRAGALGNINHYIMSKNDLDNFVNKFAELGDDILQVLFNSITGLYGNMTNNVLELYLYPVLGIELGMFLPASNIKIGNATLSGGFDDMGYYTGRGTMKNTNKVKIERRYNSFMDFSPYTTVQLYLPFHGWLTLDTNIVMGNEIQINWEWDIIAKNLQYFVMLHTTDGKVVQLNTIAVEPCVKVPVSLEDSIARKSAYIGKMGNVVGAAIGGNPIGVLTSGLTPPEATHYSLPSSNGGGINMLAQSNKPYLLIKRPTYQRPTNFNERLGVPCYKSLKLAELNGYTEIANPSITFSEEYKPMQSEIDEIYTLLQSGVIL